jgi:hypothetical protein
VSARVRVAALIVVLGLDTFVSACDKLPGRTPRRSQPAMVMQKIGATEVTVRYNRPSARGRALFGALVPFGQVWNPGADEATTIEFSRDVLFGGTPLPAGKYSIWITPRPEEWTFILSKAADVFHTPYPEGQDALRLGVRPKRGPHMETLAFYFPSADSATTVLALHWGETVIEIPIAVRGGS